MEERKSSPQPMHHLPASSLSSLSFFFSLLHLILNPNPTLSQPWSMDIQWPVYLFNIDLKKLVDISFRWNAAKGINNSDKDVQSVNGRYLILTDGFMVRSEFTPMWEMTRLLLPSSSGKIGKCEGGLLNWPQICDGLCISFSTYVATKFVWWRVTGQKSIKA